MLNFLHKLYRREQFYPSFISIFTNPYYLVRKRLTAAIKKNSPCMSGMMLDFGCGTKPYKDLFNVTSHIGVDTALSGHDHTDEPVNVFYDGKTLPFKDECFDSIFAAEVFEHIPDINNAMAELKRVLKKDGQILVTTPFVWFEHEMPFDFTRHTVEGMRSLLERHGFQIITLEKSNNYIEALFQMWTAYVFNILYTKNLFLDVIFTFVFVAPFTVLGLILSKLLPKNHTRVIAVGRKK